MGCENLMCVPCVWVQIWCGYSCFVGCEIWCWLLGLKSLMIWAKKYYCSSSMIWVEKIKFDGMKRDDLEEEEVESRLGLGRRESKCNNAELNSNN